MKHSEYIEVVKDLGTEAIKKAIVKGIVKNVPFLASGPWNYVLVKFASWLAVKMAEEAEMRIFFEFIDFRTDRQAEDFEAAMQYNHIVQQTGTEEQKRDAEKKLEVALHNLVSLRS